MKPKRTSKLGQIERALAMMRKSKVLVGIPAEAARDDTKVSNAVIGYLMETGAPEYNIPCRPFLRPGVESVEDKIVDELVRGAQRITAMVLHPSGGFERACADAEKSLQRIGIVAQNAVRARITDGPFTPLSPATLARRRAKGRSGEKPLIDSGQLRRSVTYIVKVKR